MNICRKQKNDIHGPLTVQVQEAITGQLKCIDGPDTTHGATCVCPSQSTAKVSWTGFDVLLM